jgi:hypothetical protein
MPIAQETLAAFKRLAAATAGLDQRIKKLDAEVAKRTAKIAEAIEANDTTLLDIQLAAIGGDIDEVSTLLHDANGALTDLEKLQRDVDFMLERDDHAATVGGIVARVRTGVARHTKTLKDLQNAAEDAWRKSTRSEDFALRDLASTEKDVPDLQKEVSATFTQAVGVALRADKALQDRNAKALAAAKAEMAKLDVTGTRIRVETMAKVLADREKSIGNREVAKDTLATLKDGYADLKRQMGRVTQTLGSLLAEEAGVKAMEIKPIDVKKALGALGLDGKAEAALAKVLNGPPREWEKGLDALARTFKTGATGAKYLASLRRAGLVPNQS